MCFGRSKEPSRRYGSFEYPQHMFWSRNKKKYFQLRTLIRGPAHRQADISVLKNVQRRNARFVNNDYTTRLKAWKIAAMKPDTACIDAGTYLISCDRRTRKQSAFIVSTMRPISTHDSSELSRNGMLYQAM